MPGPRKKDYSQVAPGVIQAYSQIRNVTKVARLFNMSPVTAKRILDENKVETGKWGTHGRKRTFTFAKDSCHFCHSFSPCTTTMGYCLKHRRSVAGRNIEGCHN